MPSGIKRFLGQSEKSSVSELPSGGQGDRSTSVALPSKRPGARCRGPEGASGLLPRNVGAAVVCGRGGEGKDRGTRRSRASPPPASCSPAAVFYIEEMRERNREYPEVQRQFSSRSKQ